MREIKFRAWDNKDKKMVYDGTCDHFEGWEGESCNYLSINFDGSISCQTSDDGGKNGLHEHDVDVPSDRFVLMQFTGLKDKDGREIYEGDILAGHDDGNAKVVWGQDGWFCEFNDEAAISLGEMAVWFGPRSQVIGNIYEHGHLLNQCGRS